MPRFGFPDSLKLFHLYFSLLTIIIIQIHEHYMSKHGPYGSYMGKHRITCQKTHPTAVEILRISILT